VLKGEKLLVLRLSKDAPWRILIVYVSASFLVPFMSSSITIALWSISDSFNVDVAVV